LAKAHFADASARIWTLAVLNIVTAVRVTLRVQDSLPGRLKQLVRHVFVTHHPRKGWGLFDHAHGRYREFRVPFVIDQVPNVLEIATNVLGHDLAVRGLARATSPIPCINRIYAAHRRLDPG
jgi:hypothetical protein